MGSNVYGLIDNQTSELFYVGMTVDLTKRLAAHKKTFQDTDRSDFRMEVLEEGGDEFFWIKYMLFLGCKLLNVAHNHDNRRKLGTRDYASMVLHAKIDPDKWEQLEVMSKVTGIAKSCIMRSALYEALAKWQERVKQERGI